MATFRPSFLVRDASGPSTSAVNPFGLGPQRRSGDMKAKQKTLEEYRSTAPLARRLEAIKERSSPQLRSDRGEGTAHERHGERDYSRLRKDDRGRYPHSD